MKKKTLKKGMTFRPLLVCSAVGLVCQSVYAQNVSDLSATPFANRPLHLEDSSSSGGRLGVKPNVMFFVDDSGSMQGLVGGRTERNNSFDASLRDSNPGAWRSLVNSNYANPIPCTYSAATLGTDNSCYRLYWPHNGFFRLRQQNNRIRVTIDALNQVVDRFQDDWNWNIYTLWGSEVRNMGGRNGVPKWSPHDHPFMTASEMKERIKALSPTSGTPTTERYIRLARIMKDNIEYRCQKSYIVLMSDGDANNAGLPQQFLPWEVNLYGRFENRTNPDAWGPTRWETWRRTFGGRVTAYQPYRAGAEHGVSLFSKILASVDLKGPNDRVGSGPLGRDKEGGHWDAYTNPTNPNDPYNNSIDTVQSIQTFVVGFGEGLSANGRNYLRDAATCAEPKDKCFFTPNTGAQLAAAFNVIADSIDAENRPTNVETYATSTPSASGATVAELAATLTLDTSRWSSLLKFAKFHTSGAQRGELQYDADGKLIMADAGYDGRAVIVNNGSTNYWLDNNSPITDFGIATVDEFRKAFLPWILRSPALTDEAIETAAATVTPRTVSKYRVRTATANDPARQMADVIDAPVLSLGRVSAVNPKQKYIVTAANDGMAYIFRATTDVDKPYTLALNYLPAGMQRQSGDDSLTVGKAVRATAEAAYGQNSNNPHVYLNNGGISWLKTPSTGKMNQQYVLLGNMGQGGRGTYALTIGGQKRASTPANVPTGLDAPDSSWLTEVPLWETEKGMTNHLGYTISTSVAGQVATQWDTASGKPIKNEGVRIFAFVANGYSTGQPTSIIPYDSTPTLYVYDMMGQDFGTDFRVDPANPGSATNPVRGDAAGTLIRKIPVSGGVQAGALASPTLIDSDLDGIVDFAYAGDQFGNMHRFDLRGAPSDWTSVMLYKGKTVAGATPGEVKYAQPITAAPAVHRRTSKQFTVIFGTGSDIFENDRKDMEQQMIMGIHDDLTVVNPTVIAATDSDILDQTFTQDILTGGKKIRTLTSHEFATATPRAWRILLAPGFGSSTDNMTAAEKVVVQPEVLLGSAFLTTRIYEFKESRTSLPNGIKPTDRTCFIEQAVSKTAGTSWLMGFDTYTGGNPRRDRGAYFGSRDPDNPTSPLIAGEDLGSISSAAAKINVLKSGADPFQTNENSQVLNTGEVLSLTNTTEQQPGINDCIKVGEAINLLIGNNDGVLLRKLKGKICETSLIRTDWREIPL